MSLQQSSTHQDPAYPPDYPTDDYNTVTSDIQPHDFLTHQGIQIPEDNNVSSLLYKQTLAKKPLSEAVAMLDCPLPRFWALNPVKMGYLSKQGHHFKNWKRRLAAVEGHYLYYYNSENDALPKGVLLLDNCIIEEDPAVGRERKGYCFAVTAVKSWNIQSMTDCGSRTYFFCVSTAQELNDWIALISTLSTNLPRYATEELW
jgi:hypothetical protein